MRLKRYEILLPIRYNDGSLIEQEKFDQTRDELVNKFSALTADSIFVTGHWVYKGILYEDRLIRYRLDMASNPKTRKFFEEYKKVLKERFRQLDIWITASDIEVI